LIEKRQVIENHRGFRQHGMAGSLANSPKVTKAQEKAKALMNETTYFPRG